MLEKAKDLAERTFRNAALYAFALNQSRAKVLTDPVYLAVARALLRGEPPLSPRLQKAHFDDNLYLAYRAQSRRLQYFIEDWNFDEARPELLTPRQRQMMHTVTLGETSGSAVADGFLRAFRSMPELAAFFGTWFTEELNHFIGYHAYLEKMKQRWPIQRGLDVAETEFIPYAEDPFEVAACNMYQELLGFLIYRSFAKQARDPFLAKMLSQFAKDECRHFKFYQNVVAREIQRRPEFRAVVLKVMLKATSPYNQISGSANNTIDHLRMGAYYFRKPEFDFFLDQVEYLMGARLEPFFEWYFKDVIEPCHLCSQAMHRCACTSYETDDEPAIRNPRWWQQTRGQSTPDYDAAGWIEELFKRSGARPLQVAG